VKTEKNLGGSERGFTALIGLRRHETAAGEGSVTVELTHGADFPGLK